jgi:hypothetical protein
MRIALRRSPAVLAIALPGLLLSACGGSGAGLIPTANAGPLVRDFEEVAHKAHAGNGSCTETTEAIERTEADFARISARLDFALRRKLQEGITNLRKQALEQCAQVTTTSTSSTKTHSAEVIVPVTTTSSVTTAAPPTSGAPRGEEENPNGGGTPAPGESGGGPGGSEAGGGAGGGGGGAENGGGLGLGGAGR